MLVLYSGRGIAITPSRGTAVRCAFSALLCSRKNTTAVSPSQRPGMPASPLGPRLFQLPLEHLRTFRVSAQTSRGLAETHSRKAVPNSRDINQIVSPLISDNDGIHAVCARNVATDHKFLSAVQAVLGPRPTPFSNLVPAVSPLGNDAFQPLGANCTEHVSGGDLEILNNPDSRRLEPENGFHDVMALEKRQAREIAIVVNEKVENEVMDA